jgi:biotin synthase
MCYAIPGKVLEIDNKIVTIEYFGEKRKAKNEFYSLAPGDYVYAQGGFIIQKIAPLEATEILKTWKELFFKLQEVDAELSRDTLGLYQQANSLRHKHHGNSCCIHGIIEFSNYCCSDCLYCGIRSSNQAVSRYRMGVKEVVQAASVAVHQWKFKALVFQSGEDPWYSEEKLVSVIDAVMKESPCLIILSLGERDFSLYEKLYKHGARGVLLRFETSDPSIYSTLRPGKTLQHRLELIRGLRQMGYLVMTGFLIGLPGQSQQDIMNDIELTSSLGADIFSFGPFIPHPQTPLANIPLPATETVLDTIAKARIRSPKSNILVNTSFETLDRENALRLGLMAGANSLMINVTPRQYRRLYDIYPNRAGVDLKIGERIEAIVKLLHSIGRAPTDLGL